MISDTDSLPHQNEGRFFINIHNQHENKHTMKRFLYRRSR